MTTADTTFGSMACVSLVMREANQDVGVAIVRRMFRSNAMPMDILRDIGVTSVTIVASTHIVRTSTLTHR